MGNVEKTMLADNSTVKVAPKEIMLHFSEAARLTALTIRKQGETEQAVKISPTAPSENSDGADHATVTEHIRGYLPYDGRRQSYDVEQAAFHDQRAIKTIR